MNLKEAYCGQEIKDHLQKAFQLYRDEVKRHIKETAQGIADGYY